MKTKIVRIGNSQGVRIPKPLLEEAGLGDEVELRITDDGIVLERLESTRVGWAQAAHDLGDNEADGEHVLTPTEFDDTEWEW